VVQPREAIHSNFWPKRNLLANFIPLFPREQVDSGRKENCSFFENFAPPFSEKTFKGEIFNKRGIITLPWIKSFAFVTRLAVGKWPSVRFAIQLTNKTSQFLATIR
jgi:hypothetical protein